MTHTGVCELVAEYAMLPSRRCRRARYESARPTAARAAPTATSPCTAYAVDCEFGLRPAICAKPPSLPWLRRSHATARWAAPLFARPTTASACSTAPVMSASLADERATPKPPSSF